MLKDRILAGTMAGMTATLVKNVPNLILWKLGIVKFTYINLAAAALINPRLVQTPIGIILGTVVDIITGGTLGLLIIYLFKLAGRDYWWYKAMIRLPDHPVVSPA